jgi:hypothetical protein
MRLICCLKARGLINGVFYSVESVDEDQVCVRVDKEYRTETDAEITLSHEEAVTALRLSFALCYASVQGLTIRDSHVLMLDTKHHHFDARAMIVGVSRVTDSKYLHVATPAQERALMARTRRVR